jgi:predicted N-acyltransferase
MNYPIALHTSIRAVDAQRWNALLAVQSEPTPFMQHEYLLALEESDCVGHGSGWIPHVFTLTHPVSHALEAACVLYVKNNSYGEYVFDWAWAQAYEAHGVPYYPKATLAVPFTPVQGTRLLATTTPARDALVNGVLAWSQAQGLSSLHLLFATSEDMQNLPELDWTQRETVQFHWRNQGYGSFDDFLDALRQEKRKKIRQERRKVHDQSITFNAFQGLSINDSVLTYFVACYTNTYHEHGQQPYLNRAFFEQLFRTQAAHWLVLVAYRNGQAIASSLIGLRPPTPTHGGVAYGRYWGCTQRADALHFEACYYQPIEWCIRHGYERFEGGAQGEHKLARALEPVVCRSAHWIAHPGFAQAVAHFNARERDGIAAYAQTLARHTPFKAG